MCSTPFGIRGENRHFRKNATHACCVCSTPFGIRGENSSLNMINRMTLAAVLNAFRHQRGKQLRVVESADNACCVLNAFRHQRGKQQLKARLQRRANPVLNAFRHQRGKQSFSIAPQTQQMPGAQRLSASEGKTVKKKLV